MPRFAHAEQHPVDVFGTGHLLRRLQQQDAPGIRLGSQEVTVGAQAEVQDHNAIHPGWVR